MIIAIIFGTVSKLFAFDPWCVFFLEPIDCPERVVRTGRTEGNLPLRFKFLAHGSIVRQNHIIFCKSFGNKYEKWRQCT